jgi:ribosomal protein S18 acetylase RimI-like enzyme
MNDRLGFDPGWRERLVLADGDVVSLQPITPASRSLIAGGMARLSAESSRRRFFAPRFRLSERELDQLTAVDGPRHYAVGACRRGDGGALEGLGIARYVRTAGDAAEVAITVIDAFQHRGIGRALLARLATAARAYGIDRLRAVIMPDNDPVLALFRKYAPGTRVWREGDHLAADIPLAPVLAGAAAVA